MACLAPEPGELPRAGPSPAVKARARRGSVSAEAGHALLAAGRQAAPPPQDRKAPEVDGRIRASMAHSFLLAGLDECQQQAVADALQERQVAAGEVVIREGEQGDCFYLIERGTFQVTKAGAGAGPVFTYDGSGAFGELALMYACPRQATVTAATEGVLWALPRPTFRSLVVAATAARRLAHEDVLARMPVFSGLDDQQRGLIADCLSEERHQPGDFALRQGAPITATSKLYVLERGSVQCYRTGCDGVRRLVSCLGPGDFFGEWALLDNLPTRQADCVAAAAPEEEEEEAAAREAGREGEGLAGGGAAGAAAGGGAPPAGPRRDSAFSAGGATVLLALQRGAFERLMGPLERSGLGAKIADYRAAAEAGGPQGEGGAAQAAAAAALEDAGA